MVPIKTYDVTLVAYVNGVKLEAEIHAQEADSQAEAIDRAQAQVLKIVDTAWIPTWIMLNKEN